MLQTKLQCAERVWTKYVVVADRVHSNVGDLQELAARNVFAL